MSFSPPVSRRGMTHLRPLVNRRNISPTPAHNYNGPHSRPRRQVNNDDKDTSKPLLEPDIGNPQPRQPPLAGPEIDDIDADDRETVLNLNPGVDDGFFTTGDDENNPDSEPIPEKPKETEIPYFPDPDVPDLGRYPANHPRYPDFPYAPGYGPDFHVPDYAPTDFGSDSIPDVNMYQHKKTLAQGMMDIALFSANANQLRYVLESYDRHPYYYPSIILISLSLMFQVAVGVGLIWNARYNVKDKKEICIANKINNFTIIGIFLVTVVNVFISAFGVANAPTQTK